MRKKFAELLEQTMTDNQRVWCLTGDLGFGVLNNIRDRFPQRAKNMGASEQLMLGAAVGLAHQAQIPICYSITPFVIFRPYEWLRIYLDHEQTPVKLVGSGRDQDYGHLGFSHWGTDDETALAVFSNIKIYKPRDENQLQCDWDDFINNDRPCYLNLTRS